MNTQSTGYALSWEYWRRGMYWFVPACAVLVIALMAPIYGILAKSADVRAQLNFSVLAIVFWAPLVMAIASRGFLRRHYTLPVPTASLVGWTMANGALAVAVAYWLMALGFNTLAHAGWPIWGPACWAVVFYAALQAATWSMAGMQAFVLLPLPYFVLAGFFSGPPNLVERIVPASNNSGALVWPTLSATELATSLAVVAAFYVAAVYLVGRDRRGDAWAFAWLPSMWRNRHAVHSEPSPTIAAGRFVPRTFRSPWAAQFWMESRAGRCVPMAVAGVLVVFWVVIAIRRPQWRSIEEAIGTLTALSVMAGPFVGVLLGHRSQRFDMKAFLATRPLADREQAMVVLANATAAFVASALVWLVGVLLTVAVCRPVQLRAITAASFPGWLEIARHVAGLFTLMLVVWAPMALGTALGMARGWFVPVGGLGVGVALIALSYIAAIGPWSAATVLILAVVGLLGGTAVAFLAARRRRLVSTPTMLRASVVYAVLVTCSFAVWGKSPMPLGDVLRIVGVCALPLLPIAAAPLALAWNRHR